MVYRLITENSVELRILERANSKRKLERVVVSKGMFRKPTYVHRLPPWYMVHGTRYTVGRHGTAPS
jgi:hypothetical protein